MASEKEPRLVEALFIYGKAILVDTTTKRNLRLCNKHFKNLVDASITAASTRYSNNLNAALSGLIKTEWHGIKELTVCGLSDPNPITELPSALFVKFSRLETLEISDGMSLESLPEEIGELSHLKSLEIIHFESLTALPSSLGQLTALENIVLYECINLTVEGIAPLQHLTGLTSLKLISHRDENKLTKFPDFICNLTALKNLCLIAPAVTAVQPPALGNLTNLETLFIFLGRFGNLPESIGNLNALKELYIDSYDEFTTLPESLDDLLWRKAHEEGESRMVSVDLGLGASWNKLFSPKMKQALELMKQNGVQVCDSDEDIV